MLLYQMSWELNVYLRHSVTQLINLNYMKLIARMCMKAF